MKPGGHGCHLFPSCSIAPRHVIPRSWPLGAPRSLVNLSSQREERRDAKKLTSLPFKPHLRNYKTNKKRISPLQHSRVTFSGPAHLKEAVEFLSKPFICYWEMYTPAFFPHSAVIFLSIHRLLAELRADTAYLYFHWRAPKWHWLPFKYIFIAKAVLWK